ncbi:MAG: M23 family metallopeptidase [Anaerolineae bacterium]
MRRLTICVVIALLTLVSGCRAETPAPLAAALALVILPTATATATVTPTATATATPTATATASPTATATVTPTPRPATVALRPDRAKVAQGHTLAVTLTADQPITATGTLGDVPFQFHRAKDAYWAIVGVGLDAPPGQTPLRVVVDDATGKKQTLSASVEVTRTERPKLSFVLPPGKADLINPEITGPELAALQKVWAVDTPTWRGAPMQRPLAADAPRSAPFGQERVYNEGELEEPHTGSDWAVEVGTPVLAAAPGRVAVAGPSQVRGNAVWIDHGWGVYSGYFHMSSLAVKPGQMVQAGQQIGAVGTTGRSTGPHLHWEIRVHGVAVDPLEWLSRPIGPTRSEAGS